MRRSIGCSLTTLDRRSSRRKNNKLALVVLSRLAVLLALLHPMSTTEASWVDPDTPIQASTTTSKSNNDEVYRLVFSDEFSVPNRTFRDGEDPRWTALNRNDVTNNPLHYYSHENVRTCDGVLRLTTAIKPRNFTEYNPTTGRGDQQYKEIQSAMLQSWNKFCFTGGIVEFSAKLPGSPKVGGLWPAVWMMGNLARATYVNSSERLWPFGTNVCDDRTRYSQLINSCFDTSNPHHMPNDRGRGAPEIDLLECMYMADLFEHPILSVSLQVAPGIVAPKHRPVPGHAPNRSQNWYEGIEYGNSSSLNTYFYGTKVWQKEKRQDYQTDALSINTVLSDDHFYNQHIYRMEWEPPNEVSAGGYLKWFLDGHLIAAIHGDSLQEASQTEIPSEPMYLILNTAISKDWAFPDAYFLNCSKKCWSCLDPDCACALPKGFCDNLPAMMEIDYVRVYQRQQQQPDGDGTSSSSSQHTLGCSPPSRPTADFIESRREKYMLEGQRRPLEPVPTGGGSCVNDQVCAPGGTCSLPPHTCVCQESWTGPYCRAHRAYSDEDDNGGLASFLAMWLFEKTAFQLVVWCFAGVVAVMLISMCMDQCPGGCRRRHSAEYKDLEDIPPSNYQMQETMNSSSASSSYQSIVMDTDDGNHRLLV